MIDSKYDEIGSKYDEYWGIEQYDGSQFQYGRLPKK